MDEIIFNALITYTRPILIAALTDTFWKTPPSISAPVPLILVVIRGAKIAPAIVATITIFVINVTRRPLAGRHKNSQPLLTITPAINFDPPVVGPIFTEPERLPARGPIRQKKQPISGGLSGSYRKS